MPIAFNDSKVRDQWFAQSLINGIIVTFQSEYAEASIIQSKCMLK